MGANSEALAKAIVALEGLTDEHAALIEHARTLARDIDRGESDAKTHGEYRQVLKLLLEVGKKQPIDAFEEILREIRSGTESTPARS